MRFRKYYLRAKRIPIDKLSKRMVFMRRLHPQLSRLSAPFKKLGNLLISFVERATFRDSNFLALSLGRSIMSEKDLPSFDELLEDDNPAKLLRHSNLATETIDLNSLLNPDTTESGSFNLQDVSQTSFGKLLKALPVPTLLVDRSLIITFINDACEKISGNGQAILGVGFCSFFPDPEESRAAQALLEQVFRERKPQVKTALMQIDGYRLWARIYLRSVRLGRDRFLLILIEDLSNEKREITKWKKAQAELFAAREVAAAEANKLRAMIEGMDAGIVVADASYTITEVNSWFLERLGMNRDELIGKNLFASLEGSASSEALQTMLADHRKGFLRTGTAANSDLAGMKVALRVQPIFNATDYAGIILSITDITDLMESKLAAESASKAKSDFLASMSHEIRTPMHGIIGMTELISQTHLTEEQREYLDIIRVSGDALLSLINDILDFSKIEAGRFELENIGFSLRDALGDTMESVAVQADNKGLELAFHVAQNVPDLLTGDPTRLRQIIVNLVGNAIKFTEHGEVVVDVSTKFTNAGEATLHFVVSDTGIGIPKDKLQDVFRSFTQIDTGMSRKYGGTGLGLAIAVKLAAMMEGRLWAESQLGKGSHFHFVVKFRVREKDVLSRDQPEKPVDLRGMAVLVIDDNATNRRILEEMLTSFGMKPTCVNGASAALAAVQVAQNLGSPFPLTIIDAQMPEMDGFELSEKLSRLAAAPKPIIMMLTSLGRRGDADLCRQMGISAYLKKPIRQSELFAAIQATFGMSRKASESAELVTRHTIRERKRLVRILVVEDNLVNQTLAVRLLEKRGYSVSVCGNGKEAFQALEKDSFDIILMDVEMPEMNGFDATRIIREKEKVSGEHIPIVAMTAHAMNGDRERCLASGMDAYISKPVSSEELFSIIEEYANGMIGAAPAKTNEPIDTAKLMERMAGDTELLRELVAMFLDESPKLLVKIKEAVTNNDPEVLHSVAHSLKGSVGNFAAPEAADAALHLENIGKNRDMTDAREALAVLERELARVQERLVQFIKEGVE